MVKSIFNFIANCQTISQNGCTVLKEYESWLLHILHILMLAISIGMQWYLNMLLSCISLIVNDFEHFIMCIFVIHISSLVKLSFQSFARFLTGLFLTVGIRKFLIHSGYTTSVGYVICKDFLSQSMVCLFSLLNTSKVFNFDNKAQFTDFFLL